MPSRNPKVGQIKGSALCLTGSKLIGTLRSYSSPFLTMGAFCLSSLSSKRLTRWTYMSLLGRVHQYYYDSSTEWRQLEFPRTRPSTSQKVNHFHHVEDFTKTTKLGCRKSVGCSNVRILLLGRPEAMRMGLARNEMEGISSNTERPLQSSKGQ